MTTAYKIWDIPGGIHPEQHKTLSNTSEIQPAVLPPEIILPLNQHIGAPAEVLVNVGDRVKTGQLIARNKGQISAGVHSSITGTVTAIESRPIPHPSGMPALCVVVERLAEEEILFLPPLNDWKSEPLEILLQRVLDAGLAGMGGAGFPTHAKLNSHGNIHTLIINAVECEPYITSDDRLMREKASEIIEGIEIARLITGAREVLIGIENNKPEAISALQTIIDQLPGKGIEIRVVPTKYPSGGEKQLIQLLTGQEVPSGSIPATLGIVMQNVGTVYALQQAMVLGKPLIERVVTVTGENCPNPGNWWVRLGTPMSFVLEQAGVKANPTHQLIMGGPMMGFTVMEHQAPVIKTTNCLLLPKPKSPEPVLPCIRCGMCEQACPVNLLPQQLYWNAKSHEWEKAELNSLFDCIECGACAWSCPSNIPLVQYYRFAKAEIKKERAETEKSDRARLRFEQRQERLAQEEAEKEAKRRARAEAAAKAQQAKQEGDSDNTVNSEMKSEILAAVARAKAKKQSQAEPGAIPDKPVLSTDQLKSKWETLQTKVETARAKLDTAKAENSEMAEALSTALGKLEEKAHQAKLAYQQAAEEENKAQ
ncbi:electron transport complex subunit RsxC [Gynuella sunshinyii]|uniref:Ion-translocating oxidoreductase complex subunit C n=1 Tax=Gynuella sunshinyii YC6258 TaxID=1445510 RepID=A0A0C5VNL4_9GAMM|nr:electron transport complex subunit RsxC [Gynuella sunshinyii]AJQ95906.1 putative NADH:ubiquinone oxidoreductase, subunit RnfC [Gynuella sunshinyii YC6258]